MVQNPIKYKRLLVRVILIGHISKGVWVPLGESQWRGVFCRLVSVTSKNRSRNMYKKLPVRKLTGDEQFKNVGEKHFSVLEFWRYGFSSLNSNVLRGVLAEFIVENALKENSELDTRSPWGDYDVFYKGKKIEVKCCSYIQDWDQNKFSTIRWSGLKAKDLDYGNAELKRVNKVKPKAYKSDIYILSVFKHQDHATLDILDMNQWEFYVLTKDEIQLIARGGDSVSLSRLVKNGVQSVDFRGLKESIIRD